MIAWIVTLNDYNGHHSNNNNNNNNIEQDILSSSSSDSIFIVIVAIEHLFLFHINTSFRRSFLSSSPLFYLSRRHTYIHYGSISSSVAMMIHHRCFNRCNNSLRSLVLFCLVNMPLISIELKFPLSLSWSFFYSSNREREISINMDRFFFS